MSSYYLAKQHAVKLMLETDDSYFQMVSSISRSLENPTPPYTPRSRRRYEAEAFYPKYIHFSAAGFAGSLILFSDFVLGVWTRRWRCYRTLLLWKKTSLTLRTGRRQWNCTHSTPSARGRSTVRLSYTVTYTHKTTLVLLKTKNTRLEIKNMVYP